MTRGELEQVYYLNKELEMWKQRRKEIHMTVSTAARQPDGMPYSRTNTVRKPVEEAAVRLSPKLEYIDRRIAKHIMKIEEAKIKIEKYILTLRDPKMRMIIEYRCVRNMSWKEIGNAVSYDPSYCRKKYLSFLKKLKE